MINLCDCDIKVLPLALCKIDFKTRLIRAHLVRPQRDGLTLVVRDKRQKQDIHVFVSRQHNMTSKWKRQTGREYSVFSEITNS